MGLLKLLKRCTKREAIDASKKDDLTEVAGQVVLWYFQSWGQTAEKRIERLNKAVQCAGIKAKFVQWEEDGQLKAGWEGEEGLKGIEFRKELSQCFPIGSFEAEVSAVKSLILRYRDKQPERRQDGL